MALTKSRYAVLLAPPADTPDAAEAELEVTVLYGGQLRAELEAPKHGLSRIGDAPQHAVAMWVWASLTRTGAVSAPWQEFKPRILALEPVTDAAGEPVTVPVDPTMGPSVSP